MDRRGTLPTNIGRTLIAYSGCDEPALERESFAHHAYVRMRRLALLTHAFSNKLWSDILAILPPLRVLQLTAKIADPHGLPPSYGHTGVTDQYGKYRSC
jgi:hypothetical protein